MTSEEIQQQGVLYKRRDVFKNRWRPRWFVLQAEQGIMTYYLLNPSNDNRASSSQQQQAWRVMESSSPASPGAADVSSNNNAPRRRTTSVDSNVSENSVDYDVVPRGTIYLMGCTVRADEELSRTAEDLYAFTITPPTQTEAPYYLAAKTPEARREWIEKISVVCRQIHHRGPPQQRNNSITNGIGPISENASTNTPETNSGRIHHQSQVGGGVPRMVNGNAEITPYRWTSIDPAEKIFAGVPRPLVNRIQALLQSCLPLCEDSSDPSDGWVLLFRDRDGVTSYQRTDDQQRSMIKSEAVLNHPPKQVLNLLVDVKRRQTFEKNIERHERLRELNIHNFLDYYAYHPVWPTTGRDFAVVGHWQVLQRGTNERAIVVLGCSCPEAATIKPPCQSHVRATLFVTMSLLKLVEGNKCHVTRLLSYDLEGSVPRQLTSTIMQRQGQMPAMLASYLAEHEPIPEERLTSKGGPLTNDVVIRDVLSRFRDEQSGGARIAVQRRLDDTETIQAASLPQLPPNPKPSEPSSQPVQTEPTLQPIRSERTPQPIRSEPNPQPVRSEPEPQPIRSEREPQPIRYDPNPQNHPEKPSDSLSEIVLVATILLIPVVLVRAAHWYRIPLFDLVFFASAYYALRIVVLRHLGTQISRGSFPITSFVCRLSVDLNGVLRFIAAAKELQQNKPNAPEVSVVHILVAALSRAVAEEKILAYRRRCIPWLAIDGLFRNSDDTLSVSVMEADSSIVTLQDASTHSVQEIADYFCKKKRRVLDPTRGGIDSPRTSDFFALEFLSITEWFQPQEMGQCLVISAPGSEECEIDVDITDLPFGVNVAAVLGGIKLVRDATSSSTTTATFSDSTASPVTPPKPVMSLSLTIHAPLCRMVACRRFAERVQTLVQNPELFHEHSS